MRDRIGVKRAYLQYLGQGKLISTSYFIVHPAFHIGPSFPRLDRPVGAVFFLCTLKRSYTLDMMVKIHLTDSLYDRLRMRCGFHD